MNFRYEVIVIGAGHAGCEAAAAAAKLGSKTLLLTLDMNKIAQMSCNPAVGGIAKGQIVREIDALGGMMGIISDKTAIQFRLLNKSKGPAMWSPRAQSDRAKFIEAWKTELDTIPNLDIFQDEAIDLIIEDNRIKGVKTKLGVTFYAQAVVLTVGTFLGGEMHFGRTIIAGGRISESASYGLTEKLKLSGFKTDRMKTGTPARIDGRSIHFDETTPQYGDNDFHKFSFLSKSQFTLKERPCFTLYTNKECHRIIESALPDSPLYNGQIKSIGPRYCPSIETKIVTFAEKEMHQLFLEPEGETTNEYYLNGFSSSLPIEVQINALKAIPALKDVKIYRPGYAIEYDFFDPTQLHHTLETKIISHLFFAGQINGTTGYEEAAGQGLIAGINAHLKAHGLTSFTLSRDEAYIGVLIDDLVTKGVDEPYRMFTSRAEHRILLRQDNADSRLTPKSIEIGLCDGERKNEFMEKMEHTNEIQEFLNTFSLGIAEAQKIAGIAGETQISKKIKLQELLLRPKISLNFLIENIPLLHNRINRISESYRDALIESVEINIKYKGYIDREKVIAAKLHRLEEVRLPDSLDYTSIRSLSTEAREKLTKIKPKTIAQASRISGVSPHDISILLTIMGR